MDLPVIDMPVFQRWVWMEEITYSHIPIATLITAYLLLSPAFEIIGLWKKDPRYDRLARSMIWFAMILFSPGAALGTGIPVFIIGAYPEFWSRWSNLFFWPLVAQFIFFLLEVGFLFFGYYLVWERWSSGFKKKLHICMGIMAAFWGYLVQIVWDSLGSYMLTPGSVAFPGVNEPVAWSWPAFFNPSFPLLLLHRTFGNFSYTMLLTGGVYALMRLRKKMADEDRAYFAWSSDFCLALGLAFFFAQPVLGWFFAKVILQESPKAFYAIMGGHNSPHFIIKMSLIVIFVTLTSLYLATRHRRKALTALISVGILSLIWIVIVHPPLYWMGDSGLVWRLTAGCGLLVMAALPVALHRYGRPERKRWRWLMFVAGLAGFFTFAFGGFVREASRQPDSVYGMNVKPEVKEFEVNWKALYTTCIGCHAETAGEDSPNFFSRYADKSNRKSWLEVIAEHQADPARRTKTGRPLNDEEVRRILKALRENYP